MSTEQNMSRLVQAPLIAGAGLKVGDEVEVCQVFGWQDKTEAKPGRRVRIIRETAKRWFTSCGSQFDKRSLAMVPRYLDCHTFIRPVGKGAP